MNLPKDVIHDLIPLYAANECSAASKALVEEYLRANPQEAEQVRRAMNISIPRPTPGSEGLDEMRSFREARRRVRHQSYLLAAAIFFSLLPFSFLSTGDHTYWLFHEAPKAAFTYGALGLICWIVYAVARFRSKSI